MNNTPSPKNINPIGNPYTRDWSDALRCIAISGVFCEHWFEEFPTDDAPGIGIVLMNLAYRFGSFVQLFFLLSGYSLAIGTQKTSDEIDWKQWYIRRFKKVLVPFWITCIAIFIGSHALHLTPLRSAIDPINFRDLFWNLLLLRNQFPSAYELNAAYWFIPVILGLYLIFPVLWNLLQRTKPLGFLIINLVIQTVAIGIGFSLGWHGSHASSIFIFHLVPFSIGMIAGQLHGKHPRFLNQFDSVRWPILGLVLLVIATWMSRQNAFLSANNDGLAAVSYFCVLYFIYQNIVTKIPRLSSILALGGRISFTFYLIHLPLLLLVARHMRSWSAEKHSFPIIAIGGVVFLTIMTFAWFIEKQLSNIRRKPESSPSVADQTNFSQR